MWRKDLGLEHFPMEMLQLVQHQVVLLLVDLLLLLSPERHRKMVEQDHPLMPFRLLVHMLMSVLRCLISLHDSPPTLDTSNFNLWQFLMESHLKSFSIEVWNIVEWGFAP